MITYSADWEENSLDNIVTFKNGQAHENDISTNGKYIVVNSKFISTNGAIKRLSNRRNQPANSSDVLMVMSDLPNGKALGKCYYVEADNIYTVNQRICILNNAKINSKLLYYLTNRNPYFLEFDNGVTQTNLRRKEVLSCIIRYPSCSDEQNKIVKTLESFDEYIANLGDLIEKKKGIRDGALNDLISGEKRLVGYDYKWQEGKIGSVLTILHGKNQHAVESFNGKYPILGTGGIIGKSTDFLCNWECVLIGRKGTINNPMYMNTPFWAIDTLYYSKPIDNQCVKYQYYLLCTIDWYGYTESSGRPSLAKKVIEAIPIKIPRYEEQVKIASVLTAMDEEIEALEIEREKMIQIREGAMDDLLTGRVRLTVKGGVQWQR